MIILETKLPKPKSSKTSNMKEKKNPIAVEKIESLTTLGILQQALKIPYKNGRLMLSVTILTLLPFSSLYLGYTLFVRFLVTEFQSPYSDFLDATVHEALGEASWSSFVSLSITVFYITMMVVTAFFSLVATIYTAAMIYIGREISHKDLIQSIYRKWKELLLTSTLFLLLLTGFGLLLLFIIWAIGVIEEYGALVAIVNASFYVVLGFLFYVTAGWFLGVVASVLEEEVSGREALAKGGVLIKGRRLQGFFIELVFSISDALVSSCFAFKVSFIGAEVTSDGFALSIVLVFVFCLLKLYRVLVYIVLYYECKRELGETVEIAGYSFLPSLHVNAESP